MSHLKKKRAENISGSIQPYHQSDEVCFNVSRVLLADFDEPRKRYILKISQVF